MEHANWPKNFKLAYDTNDVSKKILGCMMTEEIRERQRDCIGIEGLVTPSVIQYIRDKNLYTE
jgi:nicotinic acid mononucleotide adenylyltransferase